ncbi:hypothetical protein ABPG74_012300 [Tetrahymena malaccensis]
MKKKAQQATNSKAKKGDKDIAELQPKEDMIVSFYKDYQELLENKCFNFIQNLNLKHNIYFERNYKEFIISWLESLYDYNEYYQLSGKESQIPHKTKVLNHMLLLVSNSWPIRVHNHFISKLRKLSFENISNILCELEFLIKGNLKDCFRVDISINQTLYMTEFVVKRNFASQYDLLLLVGVEQIPVLNRAEDQITKFEYSQFIMVIDIVTRNLVLDTQYIKLKYEQLLNDPARINISRIPDLNSSSYPHYNIQYQNQNYLFVQNESQKGRKYYKSVLLTEQEYKLKIQDPHYKYQQSDQAFTPQKFNPHFLNFEESQQYEYDSTIYRWILKEKKILDEKFQEKEERAFQNKLLLQSFADFSSASNLVELLQKIPNLNLKLTQEEIDVIGQQGNVLVIGRSGTGKTTSALLRLFAMEILFHIRVQIYISKNTKILQDALTNEQIGMQSVFITASPVLANQIKRYYKKLLTQVKDEIKRKQVLQKTQVQSNQDQSDTESISNLTVQETESFLKILSESQGQENQGTQEEEQQIINKEMQQLSFIEKKNYDEVEEKNDDKNDDEDEDMFEEDTMNDRFVMTEQGVKFKSLQDLKSQDFPAFLTVRQYLMLIEGCLHNPFFLKDKDGKLVFQAGQSSWGNYKSEKQIQKLNEDYQDDILDQDQEQDIQKKEEEFYNNYEENNLEELYQRQMYLQTHQKLVEDIPNVEKLTPSDRKFEVDYAYFTTAFWPIASAKFKESSLISCNTLWTEIYSYIKGSFSSFTYFERYMSRADYMTQNLNPLLSEQQKQVIYNMFEYYEKWKLKQQGYDLMDLVNFLLKEIQQKKCDLPSIHFTMIDEVQDLPYAIITLFSIVNEQNLFLAGDSAQTIARGVGFRFGDLSNIFSEFSHFFDKALDFPTTRQLTVNFRSHNKILQLSNSVISLIEGLFPTSIDILKKERSNIDGMKPIVLQNSDIGFLFTLLQGQQSEQGQIPLEFGCHQVIIVKDEESKKKLPQILQHAICLTIYEAKGLEFDDVILFNFFADSAASHNQWESVSLFNINQERMSKATFFKQMTIHDSVFSKDQITNVDDPTFASAYGVEYDEKEDVVTIKTVNTKNHELRVFDRISNALLCSELKQLYTAITRPKKRLIIFDSNTLNRKFVDEYWQKQNLVSFISQNDFEPTQETNNSKNDKTLINQAQSKDKELVINSVKQLLVKNTPEEWHEQGLKMFKYKYFEQAIKCFKKSGNLQWEKKAQAYYEASANSQRIVDIENNLQLLKKGIGAYSLYNNQAKKIAKSNLQKELKQAQNKFVEIAEKFIEINRKKQAAQCYFSGCQYEKSAQIYLEINQIREAAESLFLQGNKFKQASELYEKIKDFHKALQCYENIHDWNQALMLIQRNPSSFEGAEYQKLLDKYTQYAFQAINQEIESANNPKQIQNETIQENESDDESFSSFDSDHIEDDEDKNEGQEDIQFNQQNATDQIIDEMTFNDDTFEQIKDGSNQIQHSHQKSNSKSSYQVVGQGISNSNVSEMSFDLLSNIDHNDEWLGINNQSIIDKLNQSRASQNQTYSEFSILENSGIVGDEFQIIQTKENTSISDQILIKILNLLAITDNTIKQRLKGILIQDQQEEEIVLEKQVNDQFTQLNKIDCDKIDRELILLVIKNLQNFNQSKLCLQICNRFQVYDQIISTLTQLAYSYSPLSKCSAVVQPSHLNQQAQLFMRKQKDLSIISNAAIHSIFESLNPELIQKTDETKNRNNIFNSEFIKSLLLFGYWKRILFLIDKKSALSIAQVFGDFSSYKLLYLDENQSQVINKNVNIPKFNLLPQEEPTDEQGVQLAIISLEHYIYHYIDKNFVPITSVKQLALPSYFKFNKFIWSIFNKNKTSQTEKAHFDTIKDLLTTTKSILTSLEQGLSQIVIFDAITAFLLLINYDNQFQILNSKLPHDVQALLRSMPVIISKFYKQYINNYNKNSNIVLRAILTTYQVRTIPDSDILSIFGRNRVIVKRNNQLASKIVKNYKSLSDQGNMYYCDIDFEHILAPENGFTTKIINNTKEQLNEILSKLHSSNKVSKESVEIEETQKQTSKTDLNNLISISDQKRTQLRIDYASKQLNFQLHDLKNRLQNDINILLQYGFVDKYNQISFESYKQNKIDFYYDMNYLAILNLIINYASNKKINLIIPYDSQYSRILEKLEETQLVMFDTQQIQNFKKQNKSTLLLNLNDYDNYEDLDEICQLILHLAEEFSKLSVNHICETPQDCECVSDQYDVQNLIDVIFIILANVNDAEEESIQDLIKALQLLKFNFEQSNFLCKQLQNIQEFQNNIFGNYKLECSRNYKKLIQSKSIDDVRDSMLDLIEEDEFEDHFGQWNSIDIFNMNTHEENQKKFNELRQLIKDEITKKKQAGIKIYKFFIKNKSKLGLLKHIFKQINLYTDFLDRFAQNVNKDYIRQFKYCLVNIQHIFSSFSLLRESQMELLKAYYVLSTINSDSISFILEKLNENRQIFKQLTDKFNEIILQSISKQIGKVKSDKQIKEINKAAFDSLGKYQQYIQELFQNNGAPNRNKKVFEVISSKKSAQSQKILSLLKKRQNIIKQQKALELKQFKFVKQKK